MYWGAWYPFCYQESDASCHSAPLPPSCHTESTTSPLVSSQGWQDLEGWRQLALSSRWVHLSPFHCDFTLNPIDTLLKYAVFPWWTEHNFPREKGNQPFLWNALSGEAVSGDVCPSIIHLKRDCWLPRSFGPMDPPRSRPGRLTPDPNPAYMKVMKIEKQK